MSLPDNFAPSVTRRIVRELGLQELFASGPHAVYDHPKNPNRMAMIDVSVSTPMEDLISCLEDIDFVRGEILEACKKVIEDK